MGIYKSDDGETSFSFLNEDFVDANGNKSFGFSCVVKSFDFSASLNGIWFYDDALTDFARDLIHLANKQLKKVKFFAMSDFELTIENEDSLGHFTAKFMLNNSFQGNSACLTTKLETQSLIELSKDINLLVLRQ